MAKSDLTAERLREVLRYNKKTGIFTWKIRRGKIQPRTVAGSLRSDGYYDIRVDDVLHRAHRLAWLYVTGEWPAVLIDHRDRNPGNTKWNNLREATYGQNRQNQKTMKHCTHGHKGLELHTSGLWRVRISLDGRKYLIGYFKQVEDALYARRAAESFFFTHA